MVSLSTKTNGMFKTLKEKIMKNFIVVIAAGALLFTGCNKSEFNITPDNSYVTVNASISDATKSIEQANAFYWTKGDQIDIWYTDGTNPSKQTFSLVLPQDKDKVTSGTFTATIAGEKSCTGYAVYPSGNHTINNGTITVNMPASYGDADAEYIPNTNAAMIAVPQAVVANDESSAPNLSFKHVGGVLAFSIKNVPVGASQFIFTANMPITGNFEVADNKISTSGTSNVNNAVTINFKALEEKSNLTFYVPLPTGEYAGFKAEIKNADATRVYMEFLSSANNTLNRADIARISLAITDVTAGAPVAVTDVATTEELTNAINNGKQYISLTAPVSIESISVPADKATTLDLGGQTLTLGAAQVKSSSVGYGITNKGVLTISGGKIESNATYAAIVNFNSATSNTGNVSLTLEGVDITSNGRYAVLNWSNDNTTVSTDENVAEPVTKITIKGGEFKATQETDYSDYAFTTTGYAAWDIDGVTLEGYYGGFSAKYCKATIKNSTIKGGTYGMHTFRTVVNHESTTIEGNTYDMYIQTQSETDATITCKSIVNGTEYTQDNATGATGVLANFVSTEEEVAQALTNGASIIFKSDISLNSAVSLSADKTSFVDLGGYTATLAASSENYGITNKGILAIKNGKIASSSAAAAIVNFNANTANTGNVSLTLEGVNITSNGRYAVLNWSNDNTTVSTDENVAEPVTKITIKGGEFKATQETDYSDYAFTTTGYAAWDIDGVTLEGHYGGFSAKYCKATIKNSTIKGGTYGMHTFSAVVNHESTTIDGGSYDMYIQTQSETDATIQCKSIVNDIEYTQDNATGANGYLVNI